MTTSDRNAEPWWQIEIEDNSALSGAAAASLLAIITTNTGLSYASVQSVEGAGERLLELKADEGLVMPIHKLLPITETIVQFDWADFFLTDNELQARRIRSDEAYPDALRKCSVLVRAIDDTYFYVYGTEPELRALLVNSFPGSASKSGEPEQLDYPE